MNISPLSGKMSPSSIRIVVLFPAPFCPRKPYISPRLMENDRSFTAWNCLNVFVRPRVSIIGSKSKICCCKLRRNKTSRHYECCSNRDVLTIINDKPPKVSLYLLWNHRVSCPLRHLSLFLQMQPSARVWYPSNNHPSALLLLR